MSLSMSTTAFKFMDAATVKFGQTLPYALQSTSSQLAALHASRTCAIPRDSCSRCGSLLTLRTRVARGKQNTRAIVQTCSLCGEASSTTIPFGNAAAFPSRKSTARTMHTPLPLSVTSPIPLDEVTVLPTSTKASIIKPTLSVPMSPQTDTPNNPSSQRSNTKKKKSTLQEMLQRNRENEKKRANIDDTRPPAGLSAFLSTL